MKLEKVKVINDIFKNIDQKNEPSVVSELIS